MAETNFPSSRPVRVRLVRIQGRDGPCDWITYLFLGRLEQRNCLLRPHPFRHICVRDQNRIPGVQRIHVLMTFFSLVPRTSLVFQRLCVRGIPLLAPLRREVAFRYHVRCVRIQWTRLFPPPLFPYS